MTSGPARDISILKQQIYTLIESSIEDTRVPEAIAAHADRRAGKLVTKTDAEQLEAQLGIPVRICRQYGMTHVTWKIDDRNEHSILLAHTDTNVHWPTGVALRQKEPAYFSARDERNAARRTLLSEYRQQEPSAIERAAAAIIQLRAARKELEQLLEYGQPLHVVCSAIEKLAGKE